MKTRALEAKSSVLWRISLKLTLWILTLSFSFVFNCILLYFWHFLHFPHKIQKIFFLVEILIQEPSDYFLLDFRSFDKMEIFCLISLEVPKIDKEELSSYEISYIQAIEYMKVFII